MESKKITTSDLRLGNWLYDDINSKLPMRVVLIGDNWLQLDFEENRTDAWEISDKKIYPIPLTPEMLKNIGFVKHKLCGYDNHFEYRYKDCSDFEITALYDCDFSVLLVGSARIIRYVHELQNIYHALTGNELEIRREWL